MVQLLNNFSFSGQLTLKCAVVCCKQGTYVHCVLLGNVLPRAQSHEFIPITALEY